MAKDDDLVDDPKMQAWIASFPDQDFARALAEFIDDYDVVGPGVAGVHVVEGLEGCASTLRSMGWAKD